MPADCAAVDGAVTALDETKPSLFMVGSVAAPARAIAAIFTSPAADLATAVACPERAGRASLEASAETDAIVALEFAIPGGGALRDGVGKDTVCGVPTTDWDIDLGTPVLLVLVEPSAST